MRWDLSMLCRYQVGEVILTIIAKSKLVADGCNFMGFFLKLYALPKFKKIPWAMEFWQEVARENPGQFSILSPRFELCILFICWNTKSISNKTCLTHYNGPISRQGNFWGKAYSTKQYFWRSIVENAKKKEGIYKTIFNLDGITTVESLKF